MKALLEHANYTVSDTAATAAWMEEIFGWHIRWQGASLTDGHSIHVGTKEQYLALYKPKEALAPKPDTYSCTGGLNHIAVVVDNLDAVEAKVRAHGFKMGTHHDYEPGRRFYFYDADGIEYEVVQYD
ncbi:VOC family protein [uncultured Sulfitobacter sp.]|uniref:VOC family protein n=1 Tax=uncultured Sulfitobacter sp. TaxID=191468 RepID=UPI0026341565|nr:VOC family protein [uncultured Sulfitobacter sp.]